MAKREFKVGHIYKTKSNGVIKITDINNEDVSYKDIVGDSGPSKQFIANSIFANSLIPLNETIVIFRKDNKVIALDKRTGKKVEARCNPADEFDFYIGAKLAFQRLMSETEEFKKLEEEPMKREEKSENEKFVENIADLFNEFKKHGFSTMDAIMVMNCVSRFGK